VKIIVAISFHLLLTSRHVGPVVIIIYLFDEAIVTSM